MKKKKSKLRIQHRRAKFVEMRCPSCPSKQDVYVYSILYACLLCHYALRGGLISSLERCPVLCPSRARKGTGTQLTCFGPRARGDTLCQFLHVLYKTNALTSSTYCIVGLPPLPSAVPPSDSGSVKSSNDAHLLDTAHPLSSQVGSLSYRLQSPERRLWLEK